MKKELIAMYVREYDKTIIFEHTYKDGECIRIELVGWYYGEPNQEDTKNFANRNYVAELS